MMTCHLSFGINVSILMILLIFGVLFSLPLKLLLNTNYGTRWNHSEADHLPAESGIIAEEVTVDFRRLRMCRNFEYESTVKSLFTSTYDGNCTRTRTAAPKPPQRVRKSKVRMMTKNAGIVSGEITDEDDGHVDVRHRKSVTIAGHILAVMLIGSVMVALIEVLRDRVFAVKVPEANGNSPSSRRCSIGDLAQRRYARKETMQAQKSFEIQGMMRRSPLRLLAARPPPLLRRSSFPAQQCLSKPDVVPISTTATGRLSRRPSSVIDSDDDGTGLTDFRRHSRLIRRH